jgi:RPA family protein
MSARRRAPAIKLRINDLLEGEFISRKDGSKALHVKTDDEIIRARIMGGLKNKVVIENDETVIIDVQDSTGTMKVRGGGFEWSRQVYLDLMDLQEGITIDVIGLVRESKDGIPYIECELCIPIRTPNMKVLRDLEISNYYQRKGLEEKATQASKNASQVEKAISKDDLIKDQIIDLLKKAEHLEEGLSFKELKNQLNLQTDELESNLRKLQSDGDIFEPMPGTFKYV